MKTQQKAIAIALIGTIATSSLTATPAFAAAIDPSPQKAEMYVLEGEGPEATTLRERGRCTDSYSKEWCDSHGFQNNRPVPHKVHLTKKEADCYWSLVGAGLTGAIGTVVSGPGGALVAATDVAWKLWMCAL